ncbi:hypothetical protein [Qipengyuania sp. ASV99]|uniref:hypothetical protein n=1 Tax=Qipengyuania sp. ASV99 TaxID=3399681 RepID=UPI003A4C5C04
MDVSMTTSLIFVVASSHLHIQRLRIFMSNLCQMRNNRAHKCCIAQEKLRLGPDLRPQTHSTVDFMHQLSNRFTTTINGAAGQQDMARLLSRSNPIKSSLPRASFSAARCQADLTNDASPDQMKSHVQRYTQSV